MKKILIISVITILFASVVFAGDSVAYTLKVKGEVDVNRSEEVKKLETGNQLLNQDELESKDDSFAAVKFIDGSSVIKLFPNSTLKINAEKEDGKLNKKSYLTAGNMWSKVVKKTGVFEVETPTTVVSVKGTKFILSVSEDGATDLYTLSGEVSIKNKKDGKTASVGGGNKAHSTGEGEIKISEIGDDDLGDEFKEEMADEDSGTLEIQLENPDGEKRTIKIDFE
jgi:hypothetical protein